VHKSRSYRDLEVWKLSIEFVKEMYVVTNNFPTTEIYGLTNQIRRAAVSIPSNIAEGQGRNSAKEFKQFLAISLGSMAELETQLIISNSIGYIGENELNNFLEKLDRIRKMIKSLSSKISNG
jgi:four helix bundle protein